MVLKGFVRWGKRKPRPENFDKPYVPKVEREYKATNRPRTPQEKAIADAERRVIEAHEAYLQSLQPKRHIPIDKMDKEFVADYRAACAMLAEYFADGGNLDALPFIVWMETFMGPYTAMWWFRVIGNTAFCKWSRLGYDAGLKRLKEIEHACQTGDFSGIGHLEPRAAILYRGRLCGVRHCADPRRVAPSPYLRCAYLQPHSRYACIFCAPIGSGDFNGGRPQGYHPLRYSGISGGQGVQADGVPDWRTAQVDR